MRPAAKQSRLTAHARFDGLLAPVVLAMLVMAGGVLGFVLWSTADIDNRSLRRQTALVERVIDQRIETISHDQESVAVWDDSVVNTKLALNTSWIDINLGVWMYQFFGHDRVLVLDQDNEAVYAMDDGEQVDAGLHDGMRAVLEPLVRSVRDAMAARAADAAPTSPPHAVDLALVDGIPAIIGVMPLVSDSGALYQAPGTEYLHVSVVFLNAGFVQRLSDEYQMDGGRFVTALDAPNGFATYSLSNDAGRFVAFYEWQPDRPGTRMLGQTAPALAIGFIIAGIVVFLLLDRLRRSARELETGRLEAQHRSYHDALTGLPNRALFDERLRVALSGPPASARRTALMLLNLDRFKQINETLGHEAGDELIRLVGGRLQNLVTSSDTLARFAGDEFAILHRLDPRAPDPLLLANRIVEALTRPFDLMGAEVFIGASVGVVLIDETTTLSKVLRHADIALQQAKADGRCRAVAFEERMNEIIQLRHTIETELREALRRPNQIGVLFQPLYDQVSGHVCGAEALTRWHHAKFGQISPAKFIPVAEASGLIEPLGDLVLRRACELGARWPGKTIAINISPMQLRNPKFPGRVFATLKRTGMRAEDLELEITESILLDDEQTASEALRTFRSAGIKVALDDFGTGYSSLNYLKRYAVDRIKIDRSFVGQLPEDTVSVAIVDAMMTMARAMNIAVTAEGVETEAQRDLLAELGCDIFQGYLYSPAIAVERLEELFSAVNEPAVRLLAHSA